MIKKMLGLVMAILLVVTVISCDQTTNTTTNTTTNISTVESTTENQTTLTTISTLVTTDTERTTDSTTSVIVYTHLELVENSVIFYETGETFNKSALEVRIYLSDNSYETIDSNDLGIRGFDSSKPGTKNIFITYDKFLIETKVYVLEEYAFPIDMLYYKGAINLKGNLLKVALSDIINEGFIPLLYGDARYILDESDIDPNNSDNLILVYTGMSVSSNWDGGLTWNREHVWPQSRLGVRVEYGDADFPSKATDIHNLKPADPDENGVRSNDYFDWTKTDNTYEPRDEVKGDIARILFYMATMYFDLSFNDDATTTSSNKTMGVLSVLLEWNEFDPVDDFERHRNEVLYSYQGNRNPFIDYPEFANLIWGEEFAS
jgi:endonuclease I